MNIALDVNVASDVMTIARAPRRFPSWTSAPPTVREYQPVPVLTLVLLSSQAPTAISASSLPGFGMGQSSRHT